MPELKDWSIYFFIGLLVSVAREIMAVCQLIDAIFDRRV